MLFLIDILNFLIVLTIISYGMLYNNFFSIIINSESIVILIYIVILMLSLLFNISWFVGFAFCYLTMSSLELALCFLILSLFVIETIHTKQNVVFYRL